MQIIKTFKTETAHIVREAISEKCKYNIHGHSYVWELCIEGELDFAGMVVDFGALTPIKQFINIFDHSMVLWNQEDIYSNSIEFFRQNFRRWIIMKKNPTAENMARLLLNTTNLIFKKMKLSCNAKSVTVHETTTGRAVAFDCDFLDTYDELSTELSQEIQNIKYL